MEKERERRGGGRKGGVYAGRGGTGLLVARPSTLFELGGEENRAVLSVSHLQSLTTGRKMYTSACVSRNAGSGASTA